jgi:N-formylglutamate deformylase
MNSTTYEIEEIDSPIIALALHDGHFIAPEVLPHIHLQEHERFREEDPYTGYMIDLPVTRVVVHTSRFQVDLNRLPDKAIYMDPEDAWGLQVWKDGFPEILSSGLREYYQEFYVRMSELIETAIHKFGYFLILDVHSYNHRRECPDKTSPDIHNPEINIGSANNHPKWQPIINHFMQYLSACTIDGKHPDVRENIVFKGGGFSQWVNQNFSEQGCVISIEFKKTFMDEWTGRASINHIQDIRGALLGSIPILKHQLNALRNKQS